MKKTLIPTVTILIAVGTIVVFTNSNPAEPRLAETSMTDKSSASPARRSTHRADVEPESAAREPGTTSPPSDEAVADTAPRILIRFVDRFFEPAPDVQATIRVAGHDDIVMVETTTSNTDGVSEVEFEVDDLSAVDHVVVDVESPWYLEPYPVEKEPMLRDHQVAGWRPKPSRSRRHRPVDRTQEPPEVVVVVSRGVRIVGRVHDGKTGEAVEGVTVQATLMEPADETAPMSHRSATTTSNRDGTYTLGFMDPGRWMVCIVDSDVFLATDSLDKSVPVQSPFSVLNGHSAPTTAPAIERDGNSPRLFVRTTSADDTYPLDLPVSRPGIVEGQVLDAEGRSLKDVEMAPIVESVPRTWRSSVAERSPKDKTGDDGRFTITGLPPTTMKFAARHADYPSTESDPVTIVPGRSVTLDLRLERPRPVTLIALTSNGEPIEGVHCKIFEKRTPLILPLRNPIDSGTTDFDGLMTSKSLAPHRAHYLVVRPPAGFATASARPFLEFTSDPDVPYQIELRRAQPIRLEFVDEDSVPIGRLAVVLCDYDDRDTTVKAGQTDDAGRFEFDVSDDAVVFVRRVIRLDNPSKLLVVDEEPIVPAAAMRRVVCRTP